MRRRYSESVWEDLKSAYLAGGEIRALARATDIPEGTALARAKRENWSEERLRAREIASKEIDKRDVSKAIALEAEERRRRHVERMENLTEKIGGHVEDLDPEVALNRIGQLERFDKLTRRTLGMEESVQPPPLIDIKILNQISQEAVDRELVRKEGCPRVVIDGNCSSGSDLNDA